MYNITSGNILSGVLYLVYGAQSVTYNGNDYTTGQTFRGVPGVNTYIFSGSGTQLIYEESEIRGFGIELQENALDQPEYADTTVLQGFAIEFLQNANDIVFNDVTTLYGFAMELLDYPFYAFSITETRL